MLDFDQLELRIDASGALFDHMYSSLADAETFFYRDPLDLGAISAGNQVVEISYWLTASEPGAGFGFDYELSPHAIPNPPLGRCCWRVSRAWAWPDIAAFWRFVDALAERGYNWPSRLSGFVDAVADLGNSHILADLPSFADGVEAGEASGHCDGSGRLVAAPDIAVPAAQPADHPGQTRERALGVWVLELAVLPSSFRVRIRPAAQRPRPWRRRASGRSLPTAR